MNYKDDPQQQQKHTPGPFTYRRHRDGVDDFWQVLACADEERVLASILFWCDDDPAWIRETEANARLFAAAPELLEALRRMLAVGPHAEDAYDAAVEVAVAVIAKAEGSDKGTSDRSRDGVPKLDRLERRPVGGAWAGGTMGDFRFDAVVYPEHAADPSWELGRSRISKLSVRALGTRELVFNWDRGLDLPAQTPDVQKVVDHLAEFIAQHIFPNAG